MLYDANIQNFGNNNIYLYRTIHYSNISEVDNCSLKLPKIHTCLCLSRFPTGGFFNPDFRRVNLWLAKQNLSIVFLDFTTFEG